MLAHNRQLHLTLTKLKDRIHRHHVQSTWDYHKRATNPFELVTSPPSLQNSMPGICAYTPISRSFFKLWEILHDFWPVLHHHAHPSSGSGASSVCGRGLVPGEADPARAPPIKAVFLAEGPGGFMEAFARFRSTEQGGWCAAAAATKAAAAATKAAFNPDDDPNPYTDELHGMTLVASGSTGVPQWKQVSIDSLVSVPAAGSQGQGLKDTRRPARVTFHTGEDGTGDLTRVPNIDALVRNVGGKGTCDLVTADGGFDMHGRFDCQETMSAMLIACEILAALNLQRAGGAFVLKIYDIGETLTMRLLYILHCCYRTMRIVKPQSSRPSSSEKYIVCGRFRGPTSPAVVYYETALRAACTKACFATARPGSGSGSGHGPSPMLQHKLLQSTLVNGAAAISLPPAFVCDMVRFNTCFIARQTSSIAKTLLNLVMPPTRQERRAAIHAQLHKALWFTHRYGIVVDPVALSHYKRLLTSLLLVGDGVYGGIGVYGGTVSSSGISCEDGVDVTGAEHVLDVSSA